MNTKKKRKVGLFVTCLVDLLRPSVGFAALKLLEEAGCEVVVPRQQTCCGQPAYNSGAREDAAAIAAQVIEVFAPFEHVVVPSGSCAGMLVRHYPALFKDDAELSKRARSLAGKTHELTSFLVEVCGLTQVAQSYDGTVTYHDACAGLRELGIKQAPRTLLASVKGLKLEEMADTEVCCGFGGAFSVKYPDISNTMVGNKAAAVNTTKAGLLLAGDLGCLMNIAGKLKRRNQPTEARHIAELLAGMMETPPIAGEPGPAVTK